MAGADSGSMGQKTGRGGLSLMDGKRLETVVDSIARFGPVTTSLVLRTYQAKAITLAPTLA
jgi:hypothetical protein